MSKITDVAPSLDEMVANILTLYRNADDVAVFEGTHWYDTAREFAANLAVRHNVSVDTAACVIAAHSMNATWKENMKRAEMHLAGKPFGLSRAIAMADNAIGKGFGYKDNPDPFAAIVGPKINPFARCVAGDLTAVATDRWAQRAAFDTLDDKKMSRWINRNGVRDTMIQAYTKAAESVGIPPAVMQAIVWVVVRGDAE